MTERKGARPQTANTLCLIDYHILDTIKQNAYVIQNQTCREGLDKNHVNVIFYCTGDT